MTVAPRALLIADLTGYTALTEAHGDHDAAEIATRFAALVRGALRGDARVVKTMGDAALVVTTEAGAGLETALALADAVEAEHAYPAMSAGLHAGPVVEREGDVYGAAVNLAARIADHAPAGRILATAAFVEALPGGLRDRVRAAGAVRFKNVLEPVALFEVERAGARPEVVDPVCRMRLHPDRAAARIRWGERDWFLCSPDCAAAFRARPEAYAGERT